MRFMLAASAALLHATLALAQPAPPAPSAAPAKVTPKQIGLAAGLLGQRVLANRAGTHVAQVMVLVPDEGSYLAAIKLWGGAGGTRFPVFIDDTSLPARQDIARFARAFKPESVVRFKADPLPAAPADRQHAILDALYTVWNCDSAATYAQTLAARPAPPLVAKGPLGIVATAPADPAWTAALALAAAHGQLLIFPSLTLPDANATMSMADADRLSAALTAAATEAHLTWAALGDQIDAVTLCLNTPVKVTVGSSDAPRPAPDMLVAKSGEALALTDLIGRSTTGQRQERWAWCAQITGSPRQAAYAAMCALFLQPQEAFLFDGYDNGPSWASFDCTAAGKTLRANALPALVIDTPHNSTEDWRLVTAGAFATAQRRGVGARLPAPPDYGGVRAGLVCVNTMGNLDFFQLANNGKCHPGDIPILQLPSLVHFVHSWSLTLGANPWTIGGRWIDHGAYAYVGSVHEPYLSAFVPTPDFCARLVDHVPLAAAARIADGPFTAPWRIAVLGDPLYTLGPAATRLPAADQLPVLPGATRLTAELPEWIKARNYEQALDTLQMLNRDPDAARLAAAAIADDPDHVTPAAALRGVLVAFNAADLDSLTKMAARIDSPAERDLLVADALWQALWPSLESLNVDQARVLSHTLRPYNFAQDALDAAVAIKRTDSPAAARTFYDEAKSKAPRPDIKKHMIERESILSR